MELKSRQNHYLYHAANFNNMKSDTINTMNPIISKYSPTQNPNSSKK